MMTKDSEKWKFSLLQRPNNLKLFSDCYCNTRHFVLTMEYGCDSMLRLRVNIGLMKLIKIGDMRIAVINHGNKSKGAETPTAEICNTTLTFAPAS